MTICRLFISTVTRELLTCRQRLADDLRFPQVAVETQENIAKLAAGHSILLKLDDYLVGCDAVIRLIREVQEPLFAPTRCLPLADGTWQVLGRELKAPGRGKDSPDETNAWSIIRATTRNGLTFDQRETVLEPSVSLPDVWDRHGQKGSHPPEWLTLPDADDPPDLEFDSGNGAGKTTRLRLFLRSANLYAVTSKSRT